MNHSGKSAGAVVWAEVDGEGGEDGGDSNSEDSAIDIDSPTEISSEASSSWGE